MGDGVNYVQFLRTFTPPWLRRYWGALYTDMLGELLDAAKTAVVDAAGLVSPDNTTDALDLHAAARRIPIHSSLTSAEKRVLVWKCWDMWVLAGTEGGIIAMFEALGFTGVTISLTTYPEYYVAITGNTDRCVQYVDFDWGLPSTQSWDMGFWGGVYEEWQAVICQVIQRFEPAHARCLKVRLTTTYGDYDVSNIYRITS